LRTDILLTYKILFGIIRVDVSHSLFVLRLNDRPTGLHSFKLLQEHCVTDTRKRFFQPASRKCLQQSTCVDN